MSTKPTTATPDELAEEVAAWAVGGGILTMILFPLALPLILLTAAAAIPLLLVAVALGLVAAVVALPIALLRRLRGAGRFLAAPRAANPPRPGSLRHWTDERALRGAARRRFRDRLPHAG
jgi:hypothetical protein